MDKLKKLVEQVGRRKQIDEALPRVDGVYLRKGMKVQIKPEKEFLENHYYENHPQKYKKLAKQIAGTVQDIETIGPSKSSFETNNVKLVGFDLWIEDRDIQYVRDFAGKTAIPKQHMEKLKSAIEDALFKELAFRTTIDSRNLSRKEVGNIIRDIANMIAKEGKTPKEKF